MPKRAIWHLPPVLCYAVFICHFTSVPLMNTYFVDLLAWGKPQQVQAAFRQVRHQIEDEAAAVIHVSRSRLTSVGLDQVPGLPKGAIARVLPLVIDARSLTPCIDGLWSAVFINQGGVMALIAMDLASPTPSTGWINRRGTVLRRAWDVPASAQPALDADGVILLEGPRGADQMGEQLTRQFLALPQVQAHLREHQEGRSS